MTNLTKSLEESLKQWREECKDKDGIVIYGPSASYNKFLESLSVGSKRELSFILEDEICKTDRLLGTAQHGLRRRLNV